MRVITVVMSFTRRADRRSLKLIENRFHLRNHHRLFEWLWLELVTAREVRNCAEIDIILKSKAEWINDDLVLLRGKKKVSNSSCIVKSRRQWHTYKQAPGYIAASLLRLGVFPIRYANNSLLGIRKLLCIFRELVICKSQSIPQGGVTARIHSVDLVSKVLDGMCDVLWNGCRRLKSDQSHMSLKIVGLFAD